MFPLPIGSPHAPKTTTFAPPGVMSSRPGSTRPLQNQQKSTCSPQTAPRSPYNVPRRPKTAPRPPKTAPRPPQDHPKTTRHRPKKPNQASEPQSFKATKHQKTGGRRQRRSLQIKDVHNRISVKPHSVVAQTYGNNCKLIQSVGHEN